MPSRHVDATQVERSFPADIASVEAARRFVDEALDAWGCSGFRDDAHLLVSELVTNAITHAGSATRVVIRPEPPDGINVEVHDRDRTHLPIQRPLDIAAIDGRGLLIVDRIAALWGSEPTDDGKVIWFVLRPTI